jgi:hypothetical protein
MTAATGLCRTKVARGLDILVRHGVLIRLPAVRGAYQLTGYDPIKGWGKLPARGLYRHDHIAAFQDFHLRKVAELDALKAYFAFVARRDNNTNVANISYEKLEVYAGIPRNRIKSALSVLAVAGLVYVEHLPSFTSEYGVANAYRLAHLDATTHMGTWGRRVLQEEFH